MDPSFPSFVLKALSCFGLWQRYCVHLFFFFFFSHGKCTDLNVWPKNFGCSSNASLLLGNSQTGKTFKYLTLTPTAAL